MDAEKPVLDGAAWEEWWLYGSQRPARKRTRARKRKRPDFDARAHEDARRDSAIHPVHPPNMVIEWTSADGVACVSTNAANI